MYTESSIILFYSFKANHAERNAGKHCTSQKHPIILHKFSIALFIIYAGPLAYEFIHKNMPEALPSIQTIQAAIHSEYKTINEGQFRFDDLVQHLRKYNAECSYNFNIRRCHTGHSQSRLRQ